MIYPPFPILKCRGNGKKLEPGLGVFIQYADSKNNLFSFSLMFSFRLHSAISSSTFLASQFGTPSLS